MASFCCGYLLQGEDHKVGKGKLADGYMYRAEKRLLFALALPGRYSFI